RDASSRALHRVRAGAHVDLRNDARVVGEQIDERVVDGHRIEIEHARPEVPVRRLRRSALVRLGTTNAGACSHPAAAGTSLYGDTGNPPSAGGTGSANSRITSPSPRDILLLKTRGFSRSRRQRKLARRLLSGLSWFLNPHTRHE